jgi:hypothetical protein
MTGIDCCAVFKADGNIAIAICSKPFVGGYKISSEVLLAGLLFGGFII